MLVLVMQLHVLVHILEQFDGGHLFVVIAVGFSTQSLDDAIGEIARPHQPTLC